MSSKIATITAGHGGGAPGAVYNGYTEQELMTGLRDAVAWILRQRKIEVRTDGDQGVNNSLADAVGLIAGSAIALDLHLNAGPPGASGVEVVSLVSKKAAAQKLAAAVAGALGTKLRRDGGWMDQRDTPHGSLWYVREGGFVVECFFLSNKTELNAYLANKWGLARAIANVVQESLN